MTDRISTLRISAAALSLSLLSVPAVAGGIQSGTPGFPGTPLPHMTTWSASCGAIQNVVARHNHAYLTFSNGDWLVGYGGNRVVKDHRFCLGDETATPIHVPARDTAQCFAGFTCDDGQQMGGRRAR